MILSRLILSIVAVSVILLLEPRSSMSWLFRPTFKDNGELINHLVKSKIIKTKAVINAMLKVDRKDFAPSDPYNDSPQYLGHGATISAPHMHGYALEYLQTRLKRGNTVLDVGSGSGILCAYMAHMVLNGNENGNENDKQGSKEKNEEKKEECNDDNKKDSNGKVIGIEHIEALVDLSIKNFNKNETHKNWLKNENVIILKGDGRKGYPKYAPYDCIHVGAAAQPNVVNVLFDQLKEGGMLVIPVEIDSKTSQQVFRIYEKDPKYKSNKTNEYDIDKCCTNLLDVMYVPLTDEQKQKARF